MIGWNKSTKENTPAPAMAPPDVPPAPSPAPKPAPTSSRTPAPERPARPTPSSPSLPAMLLQEGKASREQLERALAIQKETGAFLGEILMDEGILDESSLLSFLAKYCKIPHLSLLDYLIDADVAALVPKAVCLEHRLIPIDKLGRNLTIAMVNPLDRRALEVVQQQCPDLRIKPILCAYKHFVTVTEKTFGAGDSPDRAAELSATSFGIRLSPTEKAAIAKRKAPAAPEGTAPLTETPEADLAGTMMDYAEKKMSDSTLHKVRFAGESDASDANSAMMDTESLFNGVFRGGSDRSADSEPESADESDQLLKDVASVMMESMRDTYEILARRMALFRGIDPENIARIFTRGMTVEYEAGEIIFKKEQEGESLYLILNGNVSIVDDGPELAQLAKGDMFGEMALVHQGRRSADAIAVNNVSLLGLKMDLISTIMPRDVSVQLLVNIILTLSQRLQEANGRVVEPNEPR